MRPDSLRLTALVLPVFLSLAFAAAADAQVGRNMGVLNPNLATESELAPLPHVSTGLISSILDGRPFSNRMCCNFPKAA